MTQEIQQALLGQTTLNKDSIAIKVEYVKGIFTLVAGLVGILVLMKSFFTLDLEREKAEHEQQKTEQAKEEAESKHTLEETKAQNERFAKAIEHLGNDAIDIRLGGIFALEALMNENPERFASRVITQLCAYSSNKGTSLNKLFDAQTLTEQEITNLAINMDTGYKQCQKFEDALFQLDTPPSLPPFRDLEEVARILICKRVDWQRYHYGSLRLERVFWYYFELPRVFRGNSQRHPSLENAVIHNSYMAGSWLTSCDLSNARLVEVNLKNSKLEGVNLRDTIILFSNLEKVYIGGHTQDFSGAWGTLNQHGFNNISLNLEGIKYNQTDLSIAKNISHCLFYGAYVNRFHIQQLKQLKNCIPAEGVVDIDHLRNNLSDETLWEQAPLELTDDEVIERLKLNVVKDETLRTE